MSTEKITDRFHRESTEGVDAVLGRMIRSIGPDLGVGYAEALDVSKDTIKTWRRRGEVPMRYLTGFAKQYGLSIDYLRFGGSIQNEPQRLASGFNESDVFQAVLDAVDLLSLEKKIDAQQLAKAVVKLIEKAHAKPAPAMNQQSVMNGAGQQFNAPVSGGVAGRDIVSKAVKKEK